MWWNTKINVSDKATLNFEDDSSLKKKGKERTQFYLRLRERFRVSVFSQLGEIDSSNLRAVRLHGTDEVGRYEFFK